MPWNSVDPYAPDAKAKPKMLSKIEFEDVLVRNVSWGGADLIFVEFYFNKHMEHPDELDKSGKSDNKKVGFDRKLK